MMGREVIWATTGMGGATIRNMKIKTIEGGWKV
jgi:hypothetical protein